MVAIDWHWVALGYVLYLVAVSAMRPGFSSARTRVWTLAAAIAAGIVADFELGAGNTWAQVVVPGAILLAGYRLSGLLFVRVDRRAEAALMRLDEHLLWRTGVLPAYASAPAAVRECFELAYLLVYPAIPAGALLLAVTGHASALNDYWSVVLLAEFICYAVLPWLQTRPPMLVETPPTPARDGPIRRFNQRIAAGASIRANTIPSGHAAGALASALVISSMTASAGAVFFVLALSIAAASVLGRYHYLVDTVLGLLVAVTASLVLGR